MVNHETSGIEYKPIEALLAQIDGPNGPACQRLFEDNERLFKSAPGSSHNHQVWPGGYYDHITESMNIGALLYETLESTGRPLLFSKSDVLLVMFAHDLEKPFKYAIDEQGKFVDNPAIPDKAARAAKRQELMAQYGIELTSNQANAMKYVEGIPDASYTPADRVMGELAALCHMADLWSARGWWEYPAAANDPWQGARRVNPQATGFVLNSIH